MWCAKMLTHITVIFNSTSICENIARVAEKMCALKYVVSYKVPNHKACITETK
jgi:hypothetical protein